jgi:hypothetical protein
MTFGREQANPRALLLQERVGRDRGAVDDALGLREQPICRQAQRLCQAREAREDADRGIPGCRGDLGERGAAGGVDRDQVGEGAADIDADFIHCPFLSCVYNGLQKTEQLYKSCSDMLFCAVFRQKGVEML